MATPTFPPDPGHFDKWWPRHGAKVWRVLFTGGVIAFAVLLIYGGLTAYDYAHHRWFPDLVPVPVRQVVVPPAKPQVIPAAMLTQKHKTTKVAPKPPAEEPIVSAERQEMLCDPYNRDRDANKCDPNNRDGYEYRREHQTKSATPAIGCAATSTNQSGGVTACNVGTVNQ